MSLIGEGFGVADGAVSLAAAPREGDLIDPVTEVSGMAPGAVARDSREYGEKAEPAKRGKGSILLVRSFKDSELRARMCRRNTGDDDNHQNHEAEDSSSSAESGPEKTQ